MEVYIRESFSFHAELHSPHEMPRERAYRVVGSTWMRRYMTRAVMK